VLGKKTENYLGTILKIQESCGSARGIDIVGELGVSKPTVSIAVRESEKEGYIEGINGSHIVSSFRNILRSYHKRITVLGAVFLT
jgi:Mn-dependent DtxR family transcriptional regulator